VAITAPCAFVDPWAAAVIGVVAGWLVVVAVFFREARGIDDPVGAISVHGVNGIRGVLSVGVFATGQYGAGWNGVITPIRVTRETELEGLDGPEMGTLGSPDFQIHSSGQRLAG
jgi:ammonia channel protein AmtB